MGLSAPRIVAFSQLERWDVKYFASQIKSGYPLVCLTEIVTKHNEKVKLYEYPEDTFKILGVNNTDGIFHAYDALGIDIKQSYKRVSTGDFAYNPYRINIGSIGWVPPEHDGAFISPAYIVFSVDKSIIFPEVFWLILKSTFFNKTLRAATAGSVRMNLTYPLLKTLKIPIAPIQVQQEIVKYWDETQKSIASAYNEIVKIEKEAQERFLSELGLVVPKDTTPSKYFTVNWKILARWGVSYSQATRSMIDLSRSKYPAVELGSILDRVQYGTSEKANTTEKGTPVLRMSNIKDGYLDYSNLKHIELPKKSRDSLLLVNGDILFNRTNSKELVGKCAVFYNADDLVFASYLIRIRPIPTIALSNFVAYSINSVIGRQQINAMSRQIIGQANINSQELRSIRLLLPPLEVQRQIMERIETGRKEILQQTETINRLRCDAQYNIEQMILGTIPVVAH